VHEAQVVSPVTAIDDPLNQIRGLLSANWTAGNTRSVTPEFSTGWFNRKRLSTATTKGLVTVTNRDESHRWLGMGPSGVTQYRDGGALVSCWTDKDIEVVAGTKLGTAQAKKFAYELWQEVDRIVTENQVTGIADFELMWMGPSARLVDADVEPAVYREQGTVLYTWIKQPA
jgi:hypothetical protein